MIKSNLKIKIIHGILKLIKKVLKIEITFDSFNYTIIGKPNFKDFTIILQGPLIDKNYDYFKSILKAYMNIVERENLVVSCSEISPKYIKFLKCESIKYVLVNKDPRGPSNILVQSRSVCAGLVECETEFVVRTRVDQFISCWGFIDSYINEIKNGKVFVSGYTLESPYFHIGDMLHFAKKNVLLSIWSKIIETDFIENSNNDIIKYLYKLKEIQSNNKSGEIYVGLSMANYYRIKLSNLGYKELLSKYLIIVSNQDIGLSWTKYHLIGDFRRIGYSGVRNQIDHIKWIDLKNKI